jgi:sodium transport system permease protein
MSFSNVKLILSREIRDQLRDRRTLFMMFVLPLLLYPLLGMSYFQVSQFTQEKATTVLVVGAEDWPDVPPLVEHGRFAERLFSDPSKARLSQLHCVPAEPPGPPGKKPDWLAEARRAVQATQYDAALYFPESFARDIADYRRAIEQWTQRAAQGEQRQVPELPQPKIIYTTANERSQIAFLRLSAVLDRWYEEVRQSI